MNHHVDISVVIPIKGRPHLFALTLQSLLAQTYQHWEAVVVDDGSSEPDYQQIRAMIGDYRIRFISNPGPRAGANSCRNAGIRSSSGQFVMFLDSDDALSPTCLERRVQIMHDYPEVDFAVFPMAVFRVAPGDTSFLWNSFSAENDLDRFLRMDVPWSVTGPVWRRSSLLRLGPWDERADSWQDWEYHIRALAAGLRYIRLPKTDSFYRASNPGSISHSSGSARRAFNRARLLKKITHCLQTKGELTRDRRRALAILFFRHAFLTGQRFNRAVRIWSVGHSIKVVGTLEFSLGMLFQMIVRLAGRIRELYECRYRYKGTHFHARAGSPFSQMERGVIERIATKKTGAIKLVASNQKSPTPDAEGNSIPLQKLN